MERIAQTNLQLFNQLQREGYSASEAGLIRQAYELATRLYSGYFVGSGREQIAHLVGTAGILSSLHVPAEVVAAGLIHNAYTNGDFGGAGKGVTANKQRQIGQAVGQQVEEHVRGFYRLTLRGHGLSSVLDQIDNMDSVSRVAVLIKLCEQLEHRLNDGELKQYRKYVEENGPVMQEVALKLGAPDLADQIREILNLTAPDSSVLGVLVEQISDGRSRWIPPASCRRRFSVIARLAASRGTRLVGRSRAVSRVIRLARRFCSVG